MKKIAVLVLSLVAAVTVSNAQVCALKSNALWLGVGGLNLGAEFSVAPQWTVDLSGSIVLFSPWSMGSLDLAYMNGWTAVAEGRYYLCRAFNGHHFGAFGEISRMGHAAVNLPGLGKGTNLYNIKVAGLGVSYGYYFKLNTYWGIDTNIGIGVGIGNYGTPNSIKVGVVNYNNSGWKVLPVGRAQVSLSYKF